MWRRKPRARRSLCLAERHGPTFANLDAGEKAVVSEALNHTERVMNGRHLPKVVARVNDTSPVYAVEHGRYTVMVMDHNDMLLVTQILRMEMVPMLGDDDA